MRWTEKKETKRGMMLTRLEVGGRRKRKVKSAGSRLQEKQPEKATSVWMARRVL